MNLPSGGRRADGSRIRVREVLVFGRVPERAAAVVITAGHTRIKAKPMEGPRRARRDFCLIAVRAGLRHGRINWIDREGRAGSRGIGLLSPLGD